MPIVPFVLTSYWSSYYQGRPWYRRQAHWNGYWTSHQRDATRMTIDPRAARIGRAATRDAAIALGRTVPRGAPPRSPAVTPQRHGATPPSLGAILQ